MKSRSSDQHEPPTNRVMPGGRSRAKAEPEGADKALLEAGAMGNQAFQQRVRDNTAGPAAAAPSAPAPASGAVTQPHVDAIDIIDSPLGAVGGFSRIQGAPGTTALSDLNVPGPVNDPSTGEVANVHQVHFHLDQGSSSDLAALREIKRTTRFGNRVDKNPADQPGKAGGIEGSTRVWDGPIKHEVKKPDPSLLVVADAPGANSLIPQDVPYSYQAFFTVTATRPDGVDVAQVLYSVHIEKATVQETTNAENTVFAIQKRDLIEGKPLP